MSKSAKKNVFMLGVNDFNYEKMRSIEHFHDYNIYGVIPSEEAEDAASYDIQEMMDRISAISTISTDRSMRS